MVEIEKNEKENMVNIERWIIITYRLRIESE